jgi:hypothetical protein
MGIGSWIDQKLARMTRSASAENLRREEEESFHARLEWAAELSEEKELEFWAVHEVETLERYKAGLPARDPFDMNLYDYFDRVGVGDAQTARQDKSADLAGYYSGTPEVSRNLPAEPDYEAEF